MKNLQVSDLTLSFGERKILDNISFTLSETSRSALAGANGSGKSTLFKTLAGLLEADSMNLSLTKDSRIAYLPQSDIVFSSETVYEAAEKGYDRFKGLLAELEELEESLALDDGKQIKRAQRISEIHDELSESGYYDRKSRIETILMGLGFHTSDFSRAAGTFSGGWQMRIALAKILIEDPDFLLLDEPTNYLDIEAMTWLEDYLSSFEGGLMLVSHDQDFLDSTVNEVFELFNGKLKRYPGNYTKYLEVRQQEIEALEKAYKRQQEEIEKTEQFIEKFRYKATKAKQVQSRIKMLEKTELIEIPAHLKKIYFSFPDCERSGNDVLIIENLKKAYGTNVIYSGFSFTVNRGERLAITGRNGAGKSTLLRILAGQDKMYEGSVRLGSNVKTGYFAQDAENTLTAGNTVLEEIESVADTSDIPKVRNMLGAFLFQDDDVFKTVNVLSGGEKSRLSLLKILMHPANLLLLDEPTNHLDINSKEVLLKAMKEYGGTAVFVSHDKHFISNLATKILYLSEEGPEFFEGDWEYFNYKLKQKEEEFSVVKKTDASYQEKKNVLQLSHEQIKVLRNKKKSLKREIEEIEDSIKRIEDDIAELEGESMKSENYSDALKITAILAKKKDKEREKEEKENLWLEKTMLLEQYNEQDK